MPAVERGRARALVAVALLLSAALVAVSAVSLARAGDGEGTTVATDPTLESTPAPTASPTPAASTSPTVGTTAVPTASAVATTSPTPGPTITTYAYPRPRRAYDGLVLSATLDPGGGPETTEFTLTVKGEDGDGEVYFDGLTWGDGSGGEPSQGSPERCQSYPPLTSPPGPYAPSPDKATYRFTHRYAGSDNPYTIRVRVSSVNKTCVPNGPARETREVELHVTVTPA